MEKLKVNKTQSAPDAVQISDETGVKLIAEVYGSKCKERAALIVKAVNAHEDLVVALQASNMMLYMLWQQETNLVRRQDIEERMTLNSAIISKAKGE